MIDSRYLGDPFTQLVHVSLQSQHQMTGKANYEEIEAAGAKSTKLVEKSTKTGVQKIEKYVGRKLFQLEQLHFVF